MNLNTQPRVLFPYTNILVPFRDKFHLTRADVYLYLNARGDCSTHITLNDVNY